MSYRIIFSPEAEEQLAALYNYIADAASPDIAAGYTEAIVSYCEGLHTFPIRGTMRDDVRPGLRITNYKKRAVIAFEVDEDAKQVSIIGLFYGGQDYENLLYENLEDQEDARLAEEAYTRFKAGGEKAVPLIFAARSYSRIVRVALYILFPLLTLSLPIESMAAERQAPTSAVNTPVASVKPGERPRSLSSIFLEQAASFLGVPAPIQPGMDEGLGFHQDGTVRNKAGGAGNAGPSENGSRAASYMRFGLNGYGLGGMYGVGPGYDPLNGFDEFMVGQTVRVTASGTYLADAAPTQQAQAATLFAQALQFLDELLSVKAAYAADRSRSTDSRGEFLVELDPAALPSDGRVSVTIRAGDNQQTFTLTGAATSLISITAFSNGGNFTGGSNLYSTASLTAAVKDSSGLPISGATVTWSVETAQNNSPAMVSGWGSKKTGLTWDEAYHACNGTAYPNGTDHTTGWSNGTYVGGGKMPTRAEMQAVSPYNVPSNWVIYNPNTSAQGAAFAAGWPHNWYWTGEADDAVYAFGVLLNGGYDGVGYVVDSPVACRR